MDIRKPTLKMAILYTGGCLFPCGSLDRAVGRKVNDEAKFVLDTVLAKGRSCVVSTGKTACAMKRSLFSCHTIYQEVLKADLAGKSN